MSSPEQPKNDDAVLFEIGRRGLHTLAEILEDYGKDSHNRAWFDNITHIVANIAYALKKGADSCQLILTLRETFKRNIDSLKDQIVLLEARNGTSESELEKKDKLITKQQTEIVSLHETLKKQNNAKTK